MKRKFVLGLLLCLALVPAVAAQDAVDTTTVRGTFLSSRPVRPRPSVKKPLPQKAVLPKQTVPDGPIGVGYSIFKRDAAGRARRVEPTTEFKSGDAIRLVLEPNIDGYLYIFHSENDGPPQMLFPDPRLQHGDNRVAAHVPFEVPSSLAVDDQYRWFVFDGGEATEKVYVVVAREPITGVPVADQLVSAMQGGGADATWKPGGDVWSSIAAGAARPLVVQRAKVNGEAQTGLEKTATVRNLGLPKNAPAPTVVCMNPSAERTDLVAVVTLRHK